MAPQTIKRAKFADTFNKPSLNKQEAKKFIAKYTVDYLVDGISLPENFELKSNRRKTIIRLLDRNDKNNPRIAYAVDIKISEETIGHKSCTQILVWASPNNEDLLIGLPRKIFNHLLKTYTIMVTDQEQTPDGKRFWERRISQAFKDKNFVYFCNYSGYLVESRHSSMDAGIQSQGCDFVVCHPWLWIAASLPQ